MSAPRGEGDQPKVDSYGQGEGGQPNVDVRIEKKKGFSFFYHFEILSVLYSASYSKFVSPWTGRRESAKCGQEDAG